MKIADKRNGEFGRYRVRVGAEVTDSLSEYLRHRAYANIAVLTDENTGRDCLPLLQSLPDSALQIQVPAGEGAKTIANAEKIWATLLEAGFDRHSVLVNLGGGMIGDLGGFAAACFKRGMAFIQVPTSLLAMVDAAFGGKTGVNLGHSKNMIGAFRDPDAVFVYTQFLETLPERELRSGFAEMIKHALIDNRNDWESFSQQKIFQSPTRDQISNSIRTKLEIVRKDPFEQNIRKGLNFGHTIGHGMESSVMGTRNELMHGEAVAAGIVVESWLSHKKGMLSETELKGITGYILRLYGRHDFLNARHDEILRYVRQDKKNKSGRILCTLLDGIGNFQVDCEIGESECRAGLEYYASLGDD